MQGRPHRSAGLGGRAAGGTVLLGGVRARCPDPTVGIGAGGKEKHPAGQ